MVAAAAGESVSNVTFGLTAAYERLLAGLVFTLCWFWILRLLRRLPRRPPSASPGVRGPLLWTLANGLAGPVAGVGPAFVAHCCGLSPMGSPGPSPAWAATSVPLRRRQAGLFFP